MRYVRPVDVARYHDPDDTRMVDVSAGGASWPAHEQAHLAEVCARAERADQDVVPARVVIDHLHLAAQDHIEALRRIIHAYQTFIKAPADYDRSLTELINDRRSTSYGSKGYTNPPGSTTVGRK